MNTFDFYIDPLVVGGNGLVTAPDNWTELETELAFENDSPAPVLNAKKLIWSGSVATALNKYFTAGRISGIGITEGINLTIKICSSQKVVFDGIIDLTEPDTKWSCDRITVTIRDKRMDMVTQLMNSITYAYLASPATQHGAGIIDPRPEYLGGDYVVIPYQVSSVPDYMEAIMMATSIWGLIVQIIGGCETLSDLISAAIWDSVPPGDVSAPNVGIGAWIVATLYTIYLVILTIWAVILTKDMFGYLVSPVLTKFGMRAYKLIARACEYFNIGFSSSILLSAPYKSMIIMPRKTAWVNNETFTNTMLAGMNLHVPGIQGSSGNISIIDNKRMEFDDLYNWTNNQSSGQAFSVLAAYGYYDGTPGDLLKSLGELFNAKAKILYNNSGQPVLHFERWDFFYNYAQYTLPNISDQVPFNSSGPFNITGTSQSAFTTNASELAGNYLLEYSRDEQDVNTYNYNDGNTCMAQTQQSATVNQRNVVLKNLTEKKFEFSHAKRKVRTTFIEDAFSVLYSTFAKINNVLAFFGFGIPIPTNPGYGMIGHMMLSSNVTGAPKIFIGQDGAIYPDPVIGDWRGRTFRGTIIAQNNLSELSAEVLMKRFHYSSLPLAVNPPAPYNKANAAPGTESFNQWLVYKDQDIPVCCDDFDKIQNNNIIKTFDGRDARVDSLRCNWYKGVAKIDYRVNYKYTNNLRTCYIIDGIVTKKIL